MRAGRNYVGLLHLAVETLAYRQAGIMPLPLPFPFQGGASTFIAAQHPCPLALTRPPILHPSSLSGIFQELNMKHAVESAEPIQPLAPRCTITAPPSPAWAICFSQCKLCCMPSSGVHISLFLYKYTNM